MSESTREREWPLYIDNMIDFAERALAYIATS